MRDLFAEMVSLMVVVVAVCFAPVYPGQGVRRRRREEAGHVTGRCYCILVVACSDYPLVVLPRAGLETSASLRSWTPSRSH